MRNTLPESGADIVKLIIWSAAGILIAWAITTGADSVRQNSEKMDDLRVAIVKLEQKVSKLPPEVLLLRLDNVEVDVEELKAILKRKADHDHD